MKGKLQCYSCQTLMGKHVHVFESLRLEGAGVQPQWIQGDSKVYFSLLACEAHFIHIFTDKKISE